MSCLTAFAPTLTPYCPYGHYTMGYLYLNFFLGSELYLLTLKNDMWGKEIMEAHLKVFASARLQ